MNVFVPSVFFCLSPWGGDLRLKVCKVDEIVPWIEDTGEWFEIVDISVLMSRRQGNNIMSMLVSVIMSGHSRLSLNMETW